MPKPSGIDNIMAVKNNSTVVLAPSSMGRVILHKYSKLIVIFDSYNPDYGFMIPFIEVKETGINHHPVSSISSFYYCLV
ncbi:hypothetical protein TCA2_4920 [Paenibacillus sp. TCA20]|nr:hypothetical protein TCA2_4920 [Paenibacillus sp. TCA20]